MPELDPYAVLGLPHTATAQDITRAYRELVRRYHPDTAGDEPPAAGSLREVLAAYALLRDPARRAEYDRAHPVVQPQPRRHASAAEPYIRVGPVVHIRCWHWRR